MGGSAFRAQGLNVPRMPPETYVMLRDEIFEILHDYYELVSKTLDAPGKTDYGDIDIFVSNPKDLDAISNIKKALKVTHQFRNPGSNILSLAIPYPSPRLDAHVQIDIHEAGVEHFDWTIFCNSHGDLWGIIGSSTNAAGLTITDTGLYVRDQEIERFGRKASRIFLTNKPWLALEYLGLDVEQYRKPFENMDALYLYSTQHRFFQRSAYKTINLNSSDKKKSKKRPAYKTFVEEWLPEHPEVKGSSTIPSRQEVLDNALDHFGKRQAWEDVVQKCKANQLRVSKKQKIKTETDKGPAQ